MAAASHTLISRCPLPHIRVVAGPCGHARLEQSTAPAAGGRPPLRGCSDPLNRRATRTNEVPQNVHADHLYLPAGPTLDGAVGGVCVVPGRRRQERPTLRGRGRLHTQLAIESLLHTVQARVRTPGCGSAILVKPLQQLGELRTAMPGVAPRVWAPLGWRQIPLLPVPPSHPSV